MDNVSAFNPPSPFGITYSSDVPVPNPNAQNMKPQRGPGTEEHNKQCIDAWISHLSSTEKDDTKTKLNNILNSGWWKDQASDDGQLQYLVNGSECKLCPKQHSSPADALRYVMKQLNYKPQ